MNLLNVFFFYLFLVTILLSVAFFTLLERKVLGYVHYRLGPNKNFLLGLIQPISDLVKLFSKKEYKFNKMSYMFFFLSPFFLVMISLMMWSFFCHFSNQGYSKLFLIFFMVLNGLTPFFFLFPGWTSGSFYSKLGGYRSSAQSISYEGVFFFCIMILVMFCLMYNFSLLVLMNSYMINFFCFFVMLPIWLMSILAESNRTPYDFAEGESELVSGFNTEYGSGLFSIIFLSEYMSMFFLSFFTSFFLFSKNFLFFIMLFLMLFIYIWIRTCYPRLRYDKLMIMSWKSLMMIITSLVMMFMVIM